MQRAARKKNTEDGFTLVLVMALLIVAAMVAATVLQKSKRDEFWNPKVEAKEKLDRVAMALTAYQREYGRLPCVAVQNVALTDAAHGEESAVCSGAAAVTAVRVGAVPYKELQLSESYAVDYWENQILYAVTEVLTDAANFPSGSGTITVDNQHGNVTNQAAFVLVSHGPLGHGAFRHFSGVAGPLACTDSGSSNDQENCDGDDDFYIGTIQHTPGANFYDDQVVWRRVDSTAQNMWE